MVRDVLVLSKLFDMTRQAQIQRTSLSSHANYGNPFFVRELNGMVANLQSMGAGAADASHRALAQMSAQIDLQASVLCFVNAFWVMAVAVLLLSPLPFVMRRPTAEEAKGAAGAH
jgi:DHA2 family multidrug resistance protein